MSRTSLKSENRISLKGLGRWRCPFSLLNPLMAQLSGSLSITAGHQNKYFKIGKNRNRNWNRCSQILMQYYYFRVFANNFRRKKIFFFWLIEQYSYCRYEHIYFPTLWKWNLTYFRFYFISNSCKCSLKIFTEVVIYLLFKYMRSQNNSAFSTILFKVTCVTKTMSRKIVNTFKMKIYWKFNFLFHFRTKLGQRIYDFQSNFLVSIDWLFQLDFLHFFSCCCCCYGTSRVWKEQQ